MPDSKITALTSISTSTDPANDPLVIVDLSDTSMAASGTTKKVTLNQLLGASGTATLASATISGDLTVDSGTLRVNSSNDRVGVGTNSPTSKLHVFGSGTNTSLTISDVGANYNIVLGTQSADIAQLAVFNTTIASGSKDFWLTASSHTFNTWTGSAYSSRFVIASDGVCTWSNVGGVAGTAMTLNSTGLGVGVTPTVRLHASAAAPTRGVVSKVQNSSSGTTGAYLAIAAVGANVWSLGLPAGSADLAIFSGRDESADGTERLRIDSSGNVGIGVTPSAWFSTWKVLQLAGGSFGGPSDRSFSLQNAIVNASGQFQYVSGSSTPASGYRQFNGAHDWYTAAAGTSPNQITDFATPKMTLDASGNLILLSSNTPATLATNGQLTMNATSNTNLRFSYRGSDGVTRVANITLA